MDGPLDMVNLPCPIRTMPPIDIIPNAINLAAVKNTWMLAANFVSQLLMMEIVTENI